MEPNSGILYIGLDNESNLEIKQNPIYICFFYFVCVFSYFLMNPIPKSFLRKLRKR